METRRIARIAFLIAVGLGLFVFESSIPRPLPWLRLGLANVATVLTLFLFGIREAFFVAAVRATLGSLITGAVLNPSFLFSLSGSLMSAGLMASIFIVSKGIFGVVGISIWGALAHNLTQLALAMVLYVQRWEVLYLLPLFLFSTVVTGFFVGVLAFLLLQHISWAEPARFSN